MNRNYNKELARIEKALLNIQDKGILTFYIAVNYENGFCQNVGGITLDDYDKVKEKRVGTAYGCEIIRLILLEFGVNDFSELKNKKCYVYGEGKGFSFNPTGISALKCDNKKSAPVIWSEIFNEFKEEV